MNKIQFYKALASRAYYYNRGIIFPIAADFAAYKYGSAGSATITKNADHLLLTLSSAQGWIYNTTAVDLTNINKIWVYGSTSHASAAVLVSVYPTYNEVYTGANTSLPNNSADAWTSVDVSALTGNHYIRIGRLGSAISGTARVYELYGE